MRAVIQRVKEARVKVEGEEIARIGKGFLVLLGIGKDDGEQDLDYMTRKIKGLRVFEDEKGKMNLSLKDVDGAVLLVSNFTLYGDCRKGNRPSFDQAAPPEMAQKLFVELAKRLEKEGLPVACGRFGAMMEVLLVNDGPVTLLLDSKKVF